MNQQQTVAVLAVMIAATATFAIAPIAISSANAAPNGDTIVTCTHNGNGGDKCTGGQSTTTTTCTKENGKYVCTSSR